MTEPRLYRGQSMRDRRRDRRRRFCDSAIALFGADGYAATSVSAVCKHAALSSRQFYEEFGDREHLLRTVYDETEDAASGSVIEAVTRSFERATAIEAVFDAGIRAFVEFFDADPRLTRICFVEAVGVSPAFEEHRAERRARWGASLDAITATGVERGLLADRPDALLWTGFIGAVNAVIVEQVRSADLTTEDTLRVMRTLLRPGVLG
ncbi:TetR/AcrR family transcriptional regulator [Gordonia neofelifaecis]|uniref:Putative transcriptional regulator n=1 Tax=Gordonia neofelifaecis NRRL B-59395 TaxID=644548 RepID=F1YJ55_9ACTN|nr:TetR/AcrR family transcriptional regulator [Gordonia neofelifaecis]EGD55270.1 putative transcriptional regulator [Gordonia neofelifaecis NRRL B-59395]